MDSSDIDLPMPPQPTKSSIPALSINRLSSRKRPFITTSKVDDDDLAAAFNTSSDPAVFSSEETPDLENYSGSKRRKKKVYSGTWWGRLRSKDKISVDTTDVKITKQFKRNFDSGIFMGDESSSGPEFSSDPAEDFQVRSSFSTGSVLFGEDSFTDRDDIEGRPHAVKKKKKFTRAPSRIVVEKTPSDLRVEKVVQKCLEGGCEDIDLTDLHLSALPSSISSLNTLIKAGSGSGALYSPLTSRLRIYLGNNSLKHIPPVLFELKRLTLFSLRQNQLESISPSIRRLRKLSELNVSGNALQYLPYEIIQLFDKGDLLDLLHDPNPWILAPSSEQQVVAPLLEINAHAFQRLNRVAVGIASELGPTGTTVSDIRTNRPVTNPTRSPHLTELILRNLHQKNESAKSIISLYSDILSDNVQGLLTELQDCQVGKAHGQQCTFCMRDLVLPRYRWLEWWRIRRINSNESLEVGPEGFHRYRVHDMVPESKGDEPILPFIRVACGCVSQREGLDQEAMRLLAEIATR